MNKHVEFGMDAECLWSNFSVACFLLCDAVLFHICSNEQYGVVVFCSSHVLKSELCVKHGSRLTNKIVYKEDLIFVLATSNLFVW